MKLTDKFVGETHAIRVDVRGECGSTIRALQTHRSFRECVGQSCAEFVHALLELRSESGLVAGGGGVAGGEAGVTGVYLPEQLFRDAARRGEMLRRLTSTPGTTGYDVRRVD